MEKQFEILKASRIIILKVIENFSLDQLNKIPTGFKNNIAWNVAHLLVTHQLLLYKLSGLPIEVSDEIVQKYTKGTTPERDITQQEFEIIKKQFIDFVDISKVDYNAGKFKNYIGYQPSTANVFLNTIEDAIQFNNFHEGIHLGYILALKNVL